MMSLGRSLRASPQEVGERQRDSATPYKSRSDELAKYGSYRHDKDTQLGKYSSRARYNHYSGLDSDSDASTYDSRDRTRALRRDMDSEDDHVLVKYERPQDWERDRLRHRSSSFERLPEQAHDSRPPKRIQERLRYLHDLLGHRALANEQLLLASDKDLTVHFELDIGVDLESEIQGFSELRRFGDFRAAEAYFEENLWEYRNSPYISFRRAQMLLDMGNYKVAYETRCLESDDIRENVLRPVWDLMAIFCKAHKGLATFPSIDLLRETYGYSSPLWHKTSLGSHKVQHLYFTLLCHAHLRNQIPDLDLVDDVFGALRILLAQGRIWDWRDIFVAEAIVNANVTKPGDGYDRITDGIGSRRFCDNLLAQWTTTSSDLVTNMALLDMLNSLALAMPLTPGTLADAKDFVDRAQHILIHTTEHHPSMLKSRQFAQWLLLKAAVSNFQDPDTPSQYSGLVLPAENALDLQILIPSSTKIPALQPSPKSSDHRDKVELAFNLAQELADYQTQSMCLKQLILQSADPEPLFNDLIKLQRDTQDDKYGALRTLLAGYIYCSDTAARNSLREEILALGDCTRLSPNLVWARYAILKALARTNEEADQMRNGAVSLDEAVTEDIRSFMEENGWITRETSKAHAANPKKLAKSSRSHPRRDSSEDVKQRESPVLLDVKRDGPDRKGTRVSIEPPPKLRKNMPLRDQKPLYKSEKGNKDETTDHSKHSIDEHASRREDAASKSQRKDRSADLQSERSNKADAVQKQDEWSSWGTRDKRGKKNFPQLYHSEATQTDAHIMQDGSDEDQQSYPARVEEVEEVD